MADPEENPAENNPQDQAIRDPSREQCHINHPPEPASSESRSSVDIDPLSNRRVADQEEVTERPHLRNGSRRYNNGVASKGKFGMKGMWTPLAIWMSTTVFGTGFMTWILFVFIFVLEPEYLSKPELHNFISDEPMSQGWPQAEALDRWMTQFSKNVIPVPCFSHNDEWRPYPLFSALAAGCTAVEADIWLSDDGTDVVVDHDGHRLPANATLKSMYLDPLLEILLRMNWERNHHTHQTSWHNYTVAEPARGVFQQDPRTTFVLLLDVKSEPQKTWEIVMKKLEPLRTHRLLTHVLITDHNESSLDYHRKSIVARPITIVGSGNMDYEAYNLYNHHPAHGLGDQVHLQPHEEYHDYFYDAPLDLLAKGNTYERLRDDHGKPWTHVVEKYSNDSAYYASASFKKTIGSVLLGFSDAQRKKVREQVALAKLSGLKSRYWGLPSWPISYRDYVWDELVKEGVDVLTVDDLESAARKGWVTGYDASIIWMGTASAWIASSSVVANFIVYWLLNKRFKEEAVRERNAMSLA